MMEAPKVFVKYRKWLTSSKDPNFGWALKPGAPKEAKKLFEEFKKTYLDARKKGIYL
ncbi:MAG: hypothetical protein ACFWTZ_04110 [Burkholderia sp.]|jgi:molybdopterin-biosynthesis enzyme MoeA-like protein